MQTSESISVLCGLSFLFFLLSESHGFLHCRGQLASWLPNIIWSLDCIELTKSQEIVQVPSPMMPLIPNTIVRINPSTQSSRLRTTQRTYKKVNELKSVLFALEHGNTPWRRPMFVIHTTLMVPIMWVNILFNQNTNFDLWLSNGGEQSL